MKRSLKRDFAPLLYILVPIVAFWVWVAVRLSATTDRIWQALHG